MAFSTYQLLNIIVNVVYVFAVNKFLSVFFTKKKMNAISEFCAYACYYVAINVIFLYFNLPIVNIVTSLVLFYLLTLIYKGTVKRRLLATVSTFVVMTCLELVVAGMSGYFINAVFEENEFSSITGTIAYKLLCLIVVMLIENYTNIKKGSEIPTSSWFCIFFIPTGTFYIIFQILIYCRNEKPMLVSSMLILLGINLITFYLYDALSSYFDERLDKLLLKQQNEYYSKQLEMMNSSYQNVRSVRHDIKNHLIALDTFIKKNSNEKAIQYISQIIDASYGEKSFISTGNIDIDSILNYKVEQAKSNNIDVQIDVNIPTELNIATLDEVSILGNLIDNAINACRKLETERKINLSLKYSRGIFFITIANTFDGNVVYKDDKIATTNKDKSNHGIGLNNINNIIEKYDGTIKITHLENIFKVSILLYLSEKK